MTRPTFCTRASERVYRERLVNFVTERGVVLEYSQDIAPARGTSAGGKITLLPDQSPAEEFATLAHELAHEMMHRDERRSSSLSSLIVRPLQSLAGILVAAWERRSGSECFFVLAGLTPLINEKRRHEISPPVPLRLRLRNDGVSFLLHVVANGYINGNRAIGGTKEGTKRIGVVEFMSS